MTDQEFATAFENGHIPKEEFRHVDHLRLAWHYGTVAGFEDAARKVAAGIKRFAERNNLGGLYHETITMFWVSEIYRVIPSCPAASFAEFAEKNPWLKDKNYIFSFYSEQVLYSEKARKEWVAPDIKERK
jgi:N-formylglutamate deformylase